MKIVEVKSSGRLRCIDDEDENLWVDLITNDRGWLIVALCQQDPTIEERIRDGGLKVELTLKILDD